MTDDETLQECLTAHKHFMTSLKDAAHLTDVQVTITKLPPRYSDGSAPGPTAKPRRKHDL